MSSCERIILQMFVILFYNQKMKILLGLFLFVFVLPACDLPKQKANATNVSANKVGNAVVKKPANTISKSEFGKDWAFSVEEGELNCIEKGDYDEAVFTAKGKTYALNGTAKNSKKYIPIDEIWLDNPSITGTKIDLALFINKTLALCK